MFITCLSTSIHRVGGMRAAVEASNTVGCQLSLVFSGVNADDAEKTIRIWFDGPDARERAVAYAAAINAANANTPALMRLIAPLLRSCPRLEQAHD